MAPNSGFTDEEEARIREAEASLSTKTKDRVERALDRLLAETLEQAARREQEWNSAIENARQQSMELAIRSREWGTGTQEAQAERLARQNRDLQNAYGERQQANNAAQAQNSLRPPDTQSQAEANWRWTTPQELAERRRWEQAAWTQAHEQIRQENLNRERERQSRDIQAAQAGLNQRSMADAMRNAATGFGPTVEENAQRMAQIIGGRLRTPGVVAKPEAPAKPAEVVTTAPRRIILEDIDE